MTKSKEKPYTEKARLSTGRPVFGLGDKPMPCRLKLTSNILAAAGLGPSHEVELTATPGQIVITHVAGPAPGLPFKGTSGMTKALDGLMEATREHKAING